MIARDSDGIIQIKYANSGDVGLSGLDLNELWTIAYSTPGGSLPLREQFNQLYRYLSALAVEINQKGPFLGYSNLIDYLIGAIVTGSDDIEYKCLIVNGPSSSAVDPVGDVTGTWIAFQLTLEVSGRPGDFLLLPYEPSGAQVISRRVLEGNGGSVLDADYPDILTAWGSKMYGNVDSTHFNLPALGGYFPRFFDNGAGVDPNAATRTNRGDTTTGDEVGTLQADGNKAHSHNAMVSGATGIASPGAGTYLGVGATTIEGGDESRSVNIYIWGGIFY